MSGLSIYPDTTTEAIEVVYTMFPRHIRGWLPPWDTGIVEGNDILSFDFSESSNSSYLSFL